MKIRTVSTGEKRFTAKLYKKIQNKDAIIATTNKFEEKGIEFSCSIVEGKAKEVALSTLGASARTRGETTVIKTSSNIPLGLKDKIVIDGVGSGLVQNWDEFFKDHFQASYSGKASKDYIIVVS